ncbi:SMI1/KNR4 family protein [Streptomyces sp. SID13726]|uniref:SMI1/KNR4 family protein n=1 Tax=Streptomyces sp. SID13726 TaxID=2706058 RepID=UPI0013B726F2|nr:SMI1/KNR4 family protein [Streptomyces sp. SID13726]NEB04921.1 SMI1/KNR4 family protein [Streptomyces sp. SID13726]
MSSIHTFATWEPLLRLLHAQHAERLAPTGGHVAGRIGHGSWSVPLHRPSPPPGRAAQIEDSQAEYDAIGLVHTALTESGTDDVTFVAEIFPAGRTVLHLLDHGPAVEPGIGGPHPGSIHLVEDAVAEPWRRLPDPVTGAVPDPAADPTLLERTLRERLPDAIGATEAEIAAAEERLCIPLPEELKALYRVVRAHWEDWDGDYEKAERVAEAVGCELLPLDDVYVADASSRWCPWQFAAMEAVVTPPDAAVQGLVGSPGWIVFGDNGGGDRLAIDLTPGPRGHSGQIILLSHEENIGGILLAPSLTGLVLDGESGEEGSRRRETPAVAYVNVHGVSSVQAAADPALEVLSIGVWEGGPVSLAPVAGLPRLRTLSAYPGTLADPLEITKLTGLEYLELGPEDWRVLLDADAVPRSLLAAGIEVHGERHPLPIVDLANELLALWNRPPITRTVLEGDL